MTDNSTTRMLSAYFKDARPTLFLAGMFRSPPENFYNSESVQLDIVRSGESVAVNVYDLSSGPRRTEATIFTNKEYVPPIYNEGSSINAFDLQKRQPGATNFEDPVFQANATSQAFRQVRLVEDRIRRAYEWQASQVLQSGVVNLIDENGFTGFAIDYSPKAANFPTVGTAWSNAASDPLLDMESLAIQIRTAGLVSVTDAIMGDGAFNNFIRNDEVKAQLDNRRFNIGEITPVSRGEGATFQGTVWIGAYNVNIWTYSGRFEDPQTNVSTSFMETDKVIMMTAGARLDATFGAIPSLVPPDSRVLPFIPARAASVAGGVDLHLNAYLSPNGKQLTIETGSRPLFIPTDIDSFGAIDTEP